MLELILLYGSLIVFAFVLFVESYYTYAAIKLDAVELNPILRFFINKVGLVPSLIASRIVLIAVIVTILYYTQLYWIVYGVSAAYTFLAYNNYRVHKKLNS